MGVNIEVKAGSTATVAGPAMMHVIGAADAVAIDAAVVNSPRIEVKPGKTANVTGAAMMRVTSDVPGCVLIDGEPVVPIAPPEPETPPVITALTPDTAVAGDAEDITMIVEGTGFTAASVIVFNGYDEPTTFISDTQVSTGVKPSLFVVPADCPVVVNNGTVLSNEMTFSFTALGAVRSGGSRSSSRRRGEHG